MILAITGHRPHKLGGYVVPNPISNEVMLKLTSSLAILKPELVLSGMALGVDQWAAQICSEMNIPFDAVIAFEGYELKWPRRSQNWYKTLLGRARKVYLLSPGPYRPSLLHARNHWLVDNSDALLATWDGLPGSGTAACVEYAQSLNPPKPAYRLDLPPHIWAMAKEDEKFIDERRQQREEMQLREEEFRATRNANFIKQIEEPPLLRFKKQKPPPEPSITYGRFIDVGEDEP